MADDLQSPKRRFWQIHLSTAIISMFVASGILWLNIRDRPFTLKNPVCYGENGTPIRITYLSNGWPWDMRRQIPAIKQAGITLSLGVNGSNAIWFTDKLVYNFLVGISATIITALTCEYIIRRRSKP